VTAATAPGAISTKIPASGTPQLVAILAPTGVRAARLGLDARVNGESNSDWYAERQQCEEQRLRKRYAQTQTDARSENADTDGDPDREGQFG